MDTMHNVNVGAKRFSTCTKMLLLIWPNWFVQMLSCSYSMSHIFLLPSCISAYLFNERHFQTSSLHSGVWAQSLKTELLTCNAPNPQQPKMLEIANGKCSQAWYKLIPCNPFYPDLCTLTLTMSLLLFSDFDNKTLVIGVDNFRF
jgi:hypothetical protein